MKDYQNKILEGSFYEPELSKTKNENVFLVEKILKTKGDKCYVKWLGFGKEHNSWIDKKDMIKNSNI